MGQTYLKVDFLLGHCSRFTVVLACCKVQCFIVRYFFLHRWKTCVIVASLVWTVGCSVLDYSHRRRTCSTPLWSWRGSDVFSLVSASGVSSLWCLILTHGSNIYERWIFVGNLFPVYRYLACCTVQCFLVRYFSSFDGKLVSLPYVLCNLSVALHSMMYTIVKFVPLLFEVDVEVTCSLLSLHLAFQACDVWF